MNEEPEERLSHARYEYDMARNCVTELSKPQHQFQWNVLLAAFAVYWRNCQKFLNGSDDQNSIKAKNFIKRFQPTSAAHLKDEIDELHWHVLHLSGRRTTDNEKKLALSEALKLMEWLEANMQEFANQLIEPHQSLWKPLGVVGPSRSETLTTGPTGPSSPQATNQVSYVGGPLPSTMHTEHVTLVEFDPSRKSES